jgi:hypothetical protein
MLINYGQRYRSGLPISSSTAESTVNLVIAERMKRHMRWSEKGAQAFLQVRCAVLNGDYAKIFKRWYPVYQASNDDKYDPWSRAA